MNYEPLVSIIINTHNSIEYLKEAIESALQQTYQNVEILIYDNASTVDIKGMISSFNAPLKYYRSDYFLSLGQARNQALKLAQGDLIDFLDADDIFLPNKLEEQVPLFQDTKVGLVYSNTYLLKMKDNKWEERLLSSHELPQGHLFGKLLKNYCIRFQSAIFRKSILGDNPLNWFPEHFNMCTDYDLFLRISHSYEIRYIHKGLAKWRDHGENLSLKLSYLLPAEYFMMIPRILDYEPQLFKKYPKEMKFYMASIYNYQVQYFWKKGIKREARLSAWHALFSSFKLRDLVQSILVPWCSYERYQKIKKVWIRPFLLKKP